MTKSTARKLQRKLVASHVRDIVSRTHIPDWNSRPPSICSSVIYTSKSKDAFAHFKKEWMRLRNQTREIGFPGFVNHGELLSHKHLWSRECAGERFPGKLLLVARRKDCIGNRSRYPGASTTVSKFSREFFQSIKTTINFSQNLNPQNLPGHPSLFLSFLNAATRHRRRSRHRFRTLIC